MNGATAVFAAASLTFAVLLVTLGVLLVAARFAGAYGLCAGFLDIYFLLAAYALALLAVACRGLAGLAGTLCGGAFVFLRFFLGAG